MLTIDDIARKLSKGEVAVFIGAGVSISYGNQIGVPSSNDLINTFASKYSYIRNNSEYISGRLRFESACLKIKENNGEKELLSILMQEINKPSIRPLPAHNLLAKLPFSSYFSTNWDTLLETACADVNGSYPVIYSDEHVAMLKNGDVPIIKLHGCISNPRSIVASVDDYQPFKETKPLIEAITKVYLACKTILFLGFNLKDKDFVELYDDLNSVLGEKFMGKHMAISLNPTYEEVCAWDKKGITLLGEDLTDFLNNLALKVRGCSNDFQNYELKSTYLKELHRVTDCPTETIAINVFLEILKKEVSAGVLSVNQIVLDFEDGLKAVLKKKPNFRAFENECYEILQALNLFDSPNKMLNYLQTKENELQAISIKINKFNSEIVKRSDSVLVYSQSVRVATLLKSFPRDYQRSCTLYISECRPKCPHPFYDAIHILRSLEDTEYKKHIVTDTSITYLMKTHQITKVLMGAHAVYMKDGKMVKFVNTSGSDMILREAKNFNIPVFIIAEKKKCKEWDDKEESNISYIEEKLITKFFEDEGVDTLEVSYDLCDSNSNTHFICEDGMV